MAKKDRERLTGDIAKMSNALARSKMPTGSAWIRRVLVLVASKVKMADEGFKKYEIPAYELLPEARRRARVDGGGSFNKEEIELIKQMGMKLLTTPVYIPRDPNNPNSAKYRDDYMVRTVLNAFDIRKDGIIEAEIHQDMRPEFLKLSKNFTEVDCWRFLMLPTEYTQTLYFYLKSWADKPQVEIDLDALLNLLDVPEGATARKRFPTFRADILDPAVKRIKRIMGLPVRWEPIRQGKRKVIGIRFIFREPPQISLPHPAEPHPAELKHAYSRETADERKKRISTNATFSRVALCREANRKKQGVESESFTCLAYKKQSRYCSFCRKVMDRRNVVGSSDVKYNSSDAGFFLQ